MSITEYSPSSVPCQASAPTASAVVTATPRATRRTSSDRDAIGCLLLDDRSLGRWTRSAATDAAATMASAFAPWISPT